MKRKLIQVDFYPNGHIDYWYEGKINAKTKQATFKPLTPKESLQKRLEEFKRNKNN